jgi:hypothetical protein
VVKIAATSDRGGELDFECYWRVGGQGEGQPFRFQPLDRAEVSLGPILLNVRQLLADDPSQHYTKTKVREQVKGDNNAIDRAPDLLVAGDDPIYADSEGQRPPRFVRDEGRACPRGWRCERREGRGGGGTCWTHSAGTNRQGSLGSPGVAAGSVSRSSR